MKTGLIAVVAAMLLLAGTVSAQRQDEFPMPRTEEGWTDLPRLLVPSDGSRSLGNRKADFNDTRDQGSKIVFFDPKKGDNETAEVYWWDGERILDSSGSPTGAGGKVYGTNPLLPNEGAIRPFRYPTDLKGDPRLCTHKRTRGASGYPDWYLLRRGRIHNAFDGGLWGGRSEAEPMVVAAYGPPADGRAVVDANGSNPFGSHCGGDDRVQFHQVLAGLELHQGISHLGMHTGCTSPGAPGVPTWYIEDCKIVQGHMSYLPIHSMVRRSVSAFNWKATSHNQGYFINKYEAAPTFEEVIFYKNGFKEDPRTHADPRRTIFDRNIYQGGGAQMGHTYRNIISATGGSGGPQMRLGALCENSLIIEGYWYSATSSNRLVNPWLTSGGQTGRSAVVRNNVQFLYKYPTSVDPDTPGVSQGAAQPGNGYSLSGASFGALIEGNIISGVMLGDELGFERHAQRPAFTFKPKPAEYEDGNVYTMQRNTIRGNIGYRTGGLSLTRDWTGMKDQVVEDNVFVCETPVKHNADNLNTADQLTVRDNLFYAKEKQLPDAPWMGPGNTVAAYADAAESESWPDPDRTLKRYVTEELGLTLLDWSDDPWLPEDEVAPRVEAGEAYDPVGLKTFMAVATNMRKGGTDPISASGKPSWIADYPWDARFTAQAVVNWVREGFGLPPVPNEGD